eukprot:TRINITY_DN2842_c0_g1_i2.p1 TRINITY_DN2842_c0_g1~~TRINITY_DN2842_c0_g1_i2.p1  ORF type:complete len:271 (+),score=19.94 TRINITY_DN2842_c0_g1_i2:33-845(+)
MKSKIGAYAALLFSLLIVVCFFLPWYSVVRKNAGSSENPTAVRTYTYWLLIARETLDSDVVDTVFVRGSLMFLGVCLIIMMLIAMLLAFAAFLILSALAGGKNNKYFEKGQDPKWKYGPVIGAWVLCCLTCYYYWLHFSSGLYYHDSHDRYVADVNQYSSFFGSEGDLSWGPIYGWWTLVVAVCILLSPAFLILAALTSASTPPRSRGLAAYREPEVDNTTISYSRVEEEEDYGYVPPAPDRPPPAAPTKAGYAPPTMALPQLKPRRTIS